MARKLIVEVAADISQLVKGLRAGESATEKFTKEVTIDSRSMAKAQVDAAIKTTAALEKEAAAYRAIAHTSERGSKEQVTAARLAADAERKLAGSMGHTAREAGQLHAQTRGLSRDMSHATRGALSGSHAFGGFGRSLAFASGGFIAFHSASEFIRGSVDAAREAIVAHRSLAAQTKASGESFAENRDKVERAALSYGKFGFQNDEVIASLTVLERGTGNINKALALQGLTADLARAKNLELSKAAQTVAKVFGGQETALRRAVPGLDKNAHGMDLIREAQRKLAGQAAANTTAADRFHAVLHDTQEIVGGALLPTLNRYLDQLSKWLDRMNRSGKLQRDVEKTARFLADAVGALKAVTEPLVVAFKALADALGGNKRALELLFGAFVAFKGLKIAASVLDTAASIGKIGTEATGATGKVARLNSRLLKLVANPYTVAIVATFIGAEYVAHKIKQFQQDMLEAQNQTFKPGAGVETALVPNLAKQIEAMKKAGRSSMEIIATLRKRLGGSLKADDLIAEAFAFSSGADPKMTARIRKQVKNRVDDAKKAIDDTVKAETRKGPSAALRSQWFDARISRQLGRVQDLPLRQQLGRLRQIAALIQARINVTKDITRRLNLEDQLLDVLRQQKDVRAQVEQGALDALQFNVDRAGLTKTLADDLAALRRLEAFIERRIRVAGRTLEREQALLGVQQQINQTLEQQAQLRKDAAEKARARRTARQFRLLGLGPTGEELTPGVRALKKQIASVDKAVEGSFLDTKKTNSLIARLRRLVSGGMGTLSVEVRQKIAEIIAGVRGQLKDHTGELTKFHKANLEALTGGLGLSARQRREVFGRVTTLGAGGTVPAHTRQFALAGVGGVTVYGGVHLHGVQDVKTMEEHLMKRSKQRAHPRRTR